jgi:hypothetical protein
MADAATADIVILSTPERESGDRKTVYRVVLQRKAPRVLVEEQVGHDAVGQPSWRRLDDPKRPRDRDPKTPIQRALSDARLSYELLERIMAEYYDRATRAERRAVLAEEEAKRLAMGTAPKPLPLPDTKSVRARERVQQLTALSLNQPETQEGRSAAVQALRIMVDNGLMPK